MSEVKRLLCILSNMNTGGAETFLMKLYRNLDKNKYQMDFCVNSKKNFYDDEIKNMGGRIYTIPTKSESPIKSFCGIKNIVKENKYQYVMRINEHSLSVIDLLAAKAGGAKRLIMRSSNASSGSKKSIILHKLFKFLPMYIPDVKIAPSKLAAEYTFGKKAVNTGKVIILYNGVDIDLFKFNDDIRNLYRKKFKLEDKLVIGHIGRFNEQKNHKFLISVFKKIREKQNNAVLMLIGEGNLEQEIKKQVKELSLSDSVLFLGVRKDISQLLLAMDGFLFPSFYEGMPNTVIEAQTTGLPCIVSDTITREATVTNNVYFLPLNSNVNEWSEVVINCIKTNIDRKATANVMIQKGYDIKKCTEKFVAIVFD
ncbi:MAG: glycosyltransferase family 1 protein [Clostridium sp.]|nr:glycosyltransferase family 1 protein [Clostridium sp.]